MVPTVARQMAAFNTINVKIACLITADMDRMAQVRVGEYVKFRKVTVEDARSILKQSISSVQEHNILKV